METQAFLRISFLLLPLNRPISIARKWIHPISGMSCCGLILLDDSDNQPCLIHGIQNCVVYRTQWVAPQGSLFVVVSSFSILAGCLLETGKVLSQLGRWALHWLQIVSNSFFLVDLPCQVTKLSLWNSWGGGEDQCFFSLLLVWVLYII